MTCWLLLTVVRILLADEEEYGGANSSYGNIIELCGRLGSCFFMVRLILNIMFRIRRS